MPVTTYLGYVPKHSNKELQELLEELSERTGTLWCAEVYILTSHWFKADEYVTYLYKKLKPDWDEYQQLMCVHTDGELRAYLFGALGQVIENEKVAKK